MDNRLVLFSILAGMMLLLGCAAQSDNAKPAPAPAAGGDAAKPAQSGASTFPADINSDAGFNSTYGELDAVQ